MKMRLPAAVIILGLLIAISYCIALAAIDAPHNESNNVNCGSCHGEGVLESVFWGGSGTYDRICTDKCHTEPFCPYTDLYAPSVKTHVDSDENELAECRTCHDPHYQKQKNYKNTDWNNLYLAYGTITSYEYYDPDEYEVTYSDPDLRNTSVLAYSSIIYKTETGWDAVRLAGKTESCRHTILFPNVKKLGFSYPIIEVNESDNTITVKGDVTPVYQYIFTSDFAVMYGQYIRDNINGNPVKFFDRKGANSFADGGETYNGVCEVCHTQTMYHRNDGLGAPHYPAVRCTICHAHVVSFADTDHTGTSGEDCEGCHGWDADNGGAGTTISHSTHMENDADDLKGPVLTCDTCHDTNNYPFFKSGTDNDADGKYNLSETNVCDNCHSPNGSYNGVNSVGGSIGAKDNWSEGVYASPTLKAGKEKWCAGCHDEVPAYSKRDYIEIIIDNTGANFSTGGTGWNSRTSTQHYGSNYLYHVAGTGTNTATWTPNIPQAGEYSVYAWWVDSTARATNAPYTITYNGGSETVTVNQKSMGQTWNYLGNYTFAAGTSGSVVLSDNANGQVVADAIKIESGVRASYAPNVIGDNVTYGFYATGHKINCLSCHDADKRHIDGNPRTYEVDEGPPKVVVNPYCDSYRLRYIDGEPSMIVPRVGASALDNWRDFALCFDCHNRYEVIGETSSDVSSTNFWNDDTSDANSHWLHLGMNNVADSDFDNAQDSGVTCIACHNVHGAIRGPMIRHGELISPPGTTRYVPSFNFYYYVPGDGSATATFTPTLPDGTYNVYAWWSVHPNRATNAKYLINHDGGQDEVVVNQEINGGQWNLLGASYTINTASGSVILTSEGANEYIMADAIGWDSDGVFTDDWNCDGINDPEFLIDDPDATYTGTWTNATNNSYGTYRRDSTGAGDSVTWTPNIPSSGNYSVYAWWRADTNLATDAPYTITHDGGGPAIVNKNQRQDGGTWNLLGTYQFASGTSGSVKLDETLTGRIIADAIGWDSDGNFTNDWNCDGVNDPEIIIDDPGASFTGSWTTLTQDGRYKHSTSYYHAPIMDASASATESVGAIMASGGLNSNHSCGT